MLKEGKAHVVRRKPFTIRLLYEPETRVVRDYMGTTDCGRTNIGNSIIDMEAEEVCYTDHVETRNRDIPKLMSERKRNRQASRRGERQNKKRLAKRHGTLSAKLQNGRLLPGCKEPLMVRDIINKEARFMNRKREPGWLTPTVRHLILTHLNHVEQMRSLYHIADWTIELNRFAFMRMEDGSVRGVDFQNGRMKGYKSVEDYVFALQDGRCACCGEPLKDIHHIWPRHKGGSDGPDNRIGLCKECHHLVHTGKLDIDKVGEKQKYGALSVLNQAVPYILEGLIERFGEDHVHTCFGWQTNRTWEEMGLPKDHHADAIAMGTHVLGHRLSPEKAEHYEVKQYRRQDRALIKAQTERTYKERYYDEEKKMWRYRTVAKNRKPREEQKGLSLQDWFEAKVKEKGQKEAERQRSRLKVIRSSRKYSDPDRIMPGAVFEYKGKSHVLSGTLTNGQYFWAEDDKSRKKTNYPAKKMPGSYQEHRSCLPVANSSPSFAPLGLEEGVFFAKPDKIFGVKDLYFFQDML